LWFKKLLIWLKKFVSQILAHDDPEGILIHDDSVKNIVEGDTSL
jgi:hypothetical protein